MVHKQSHESRKQLSKEAKNNVSAQNDNKQLAWCLEGYPERMHKIVAVYMKDAVKPDKPIKAVNKTSAKPKPSTVQKIKSESRPMSQQSEESNTEILGSLPAVDNTNVMTPPRARKAPEPFGKGSLQRLAKQEAEQLRQSQVSNNSKKTTTTSEYVSNSNATPSSEQTQPRVQADVSQVQVNSMLTVPPYEKAPLFAQ